MKRRAFILGAFGTTVVATTQRATACSCSLPPLAEVFRSSDRVLLGEVTRVEQITTQPVHGKKADYVALIRALEFFKGAAEPEVRVYFSNRFEAQNRSGEEGEEVVISSCDAAMAVGEQYVILEKRGERLELTSWCVDRIHIASRIRLDFLACGR